MKNTIDEFLNTTLEKLKGILKTENVIGEPIVGMDKSVIIPISKISFGFISGGGEYGESNNKIKNGDYPLATGGGAGVSIKPLGFLVCGIGTQKLITLEDGDKSNDTRWSEILSNIASKIMKSKKE